MNKQSLYKLFLLPALIFAGIIFSGFLLLRPELGQVSSKRADLLEEKTKLSQLTAKLATLGGLDVGELETKTNIILKALPVEKDVPQVLLAIKNLTQNAGLVLESVGVEPGEISTSSAQTTQKYNLPFLDFKITIAGNMEQLINFLAKIESTTPLMRVETIDISQTKEGGTEAALNIDAFFLPLPGSLGSTEKQLNPITTQEEKIYQKLSKLESPLPLVTAPGGSLPGVTSGKANPFSL